MVFDGCIPILVCGLSALAQGEMPHGSLIFDILFVLPQKDKSDESAIMDICWEIGFENDRVITPVILDRKQFERGPMSESALIDNILHEGVAA